MKNHEQFGLDSLLEYSPSKWLAERNPVVVKFIELLLITKRKINIKGKRFSEIAQTKRIDFIKARLIKRTSLGIWQPIPVTREEADNQKDESSLTKSQLLSVINALTPLLGDLERSRFRDLSSKSRDDLMLEIYYPKALLILIKNNRCFQTFFPLIANVL